MNRKTAIFLVITGNIIWGASFMFSKIALLYSDTLVMLALRFTLAFASMSLLTLFFKNKGPFALHFKGRDLKPLIVLSIFQPIAYFYFEAMGIKLTSAVLSSVIIATIPIFALFLEALQYRMKIPKDKLFFSFISVTGVAVVSSSGSQEGKTSVLGILFLLLAVITCLGFNFMSQKTSRTFTAYERTYFMFMMGALFYIPAALIKTGFDLEVILSPFKILNFNIAIFYLGVLSSVVAFSFINQGLVVLTISETTVFNTLVTIVGVLCGMFLLHEGITITKITGCVIIILGLLGFNKSFKTSSH